MAVLDQPLTARQLAIRTGLRRDMCSFLLWELSVYGLARCLNPESRRSRLYWLTKRGARCVRRLGLDPDRSASTFDHLDASVYGRLCFSQRAAVVRALRGTMRPAEMKRRIRASNEQARISANNVRDVVASLRAWGVVRPVLPRRGHPKYELTPAGQTCRELLLRAEVRR